MLHPISIILLIVIGRDEKWLRDKLRIYRDWGFGIAEITDFTNSSIAPASHL
jgi:hypothetical protein